MPRVTILVCGEPLRGDDGVALAVADALDRTGDPAIQIRKVGSLMPDDLVAIVGPVVVLDAVVGPAPGSVVDLPLAAVAADGSSIPPARSSHALPLPATLGIVAHLRDNGLPPGRFLGIAIGRVGFGEQMTPEVAAAIPRAARRLAAWVRVFADTDGVPACA